MDQIIKLYSYGAIVDGEPIRYAPNKEKKPITPVNPMMMSIERKYKLGISQAMRTNLYSETW